MTKTNILSSEIQAHKASGSGVVDINNLRQSNAGANINVVAGPSFSPPPLVPAQDVFAFYYGAVYSPLNDRLYFAPGVAYWNFPGNTAWQYLDCTTQKLVNYTGSYGDVAYLGGAYDQVNDRIYFSPTGPVATKSLTYMDCKSATTVQYAAAPGTMVDYPYAGAAYSDTQKKIYFAPHGQSSSTTWHYIDCTTGSIGTYTAPAGIPQYAYIGAVYAPSQDRIYFIPANVANQSSWHYVDCSTGNVVAYPADNMADWGNILPAALGASQVQSMCVFNNNLFVNLWNDTSSIFQSWTGSAWSTVTPVGWPTNGFAIDQVAYNGSLYSLVETGTAAAKVISYDGVSTWADVTPAWDSNTYHPTCQTVFSGALYVGAQNEVVGAQLWQYYLGSWTAYTGPWNSLGTEVTALTSDSVNLYVATNGPSGSSLTKDSGVTLTLPWSTTLSTIPLMYVIGSLLYVWVRSASGIAVWTYNGKVWNNRTPTSANAVGWSAPGAYVISQCQLRGFSYVAISSPLNGTQLWRDDGSTWEKVVSLSYDFVSMISTQGGALGYSLFTGRDVVGNCLLMQNQVQPTYPYGTSYLTGVYSPMQNRIYLAPNQAVADTSWQYIDCNTGTVQTYEHGLSSPSPSAFGSYSAIENRIYFGRFTDQITPYAVNYVDCSTGIWGTIANSLFAPANLSVYYSPSAETTFFVPFLIPGEAIVTIQVLTSDTLSPITSSNPSYGIG